MWKMRHFKNVAALNFCIACLCFRYSTSEEKIWVKLCSAPYRDMYALGLVGDALYLIGGQMKVRNHYVITDSVNRWSLKRRGSWLSFAPLPLALACLCTVSLKERLYVLGGWTPQVQEEVQCAGGVCNHVSEGKAVLCVGLGQLKEKS